MPRFTRHGFQETRSDRAPGIERLRPSALTALLAFLTLSYLSPVIAHAQVVIGAPVAPLAVTVDPTRSDPPPPPRIVPEGEPLPTGTPAPSQPIPDPTIQVEADGAALLLEAPGALSAPVVNFAGINSFLPPDTVGDIGPNHFVQMVNATQFQVWDKAGTSLSGPLTFGNLWPAGNVCRRNDGDPIVVYDHLADRWLLSQFRDGRPGNGAGDNNSGFCIAISQTPNPAAGTWFLYFMSTGAIFPDYPKYGVWPDGYYVTTYESGNLGIFVMDRANMLLGNAAGYIKWGTLNALGTATVRDTRILPADLDGPPPASGTPAIFLRTVDNAQDPPTVNDRIEIYEAVVDWQALTFNVNLVSTLTPAAFNTMTCNRVGGAAQPIRDCIPVPVANATVDALSNRPMMQLKYRLLGSEQVLVVNQAINVQGAFGNAIPFAPAQEVAGIRWYELRNNGGGWAIRQQGTYAPQPNGATAENQLLHRWMGSMAIDKDGNIALGYSITNSDPANPIHPSIRYTGRRFDDPLGFMPELEQSILAGTTSPAGLGTRWGDYSTLSVDPADDCTFWFTTHVNGGATQIASFRFDTCATDLEIAKTAPASAVAGAQLTYTITVTNHGPINATNVTVVDTLPAGTTFVVDTDSCVQAPAGTLTCSLGTIASGASSSFNITVAINPGLTASSGTTTITNTATVSADQGELDPSNNTVTLITQVNESADLRLTKDCKPDGPAVTGSTATCTIVVDNLGPSEARNVVVTDTHISNGLFTITSATFSPPPATACTIAGGVVTCNLGNEPAGGRTTIVVNVTSNAQVDVNDTASVESSTPDPNLANNIASDALQFRGSADLGITKTSTPSPVRAGTNITYTINVTNNGPSEAPNVVVNDTLPSQVSDVTFTPSQGSCFGGIPGNPGLPLTCTLGSLANGAGATITIVAMVNASAPHGTVLVNNAVVRSDFADPNNGNNTVTALTTVNASADLAITKTSDQNVYKPSSLITYTVTVRNNGDSDALAVVVTDTLPATQQALYQSDTGGCTKSGGILTCTMGNLGVGQSRSFNINIVVKGSRGQVTNTATVTSSTSDHVPGNNTAVRVVTVGK